MGASLSDLRKERDRLIVFTNQKKSIEDKLLQRERGLEEREAAARSFEEQLNQRSEKISVEETALLELVNEVKRPEAEYDQLRKELEKLKKKNDKLSLKIQTFTEENQAALDQAEKSKQSLRERLATERSKARSLRRELKVANEDAASFENLSQVLAKDLKLLQTKYDYELEQLEAANEELDSLRKERTTLRRENQEATKENLELQARVLKYDKTIESLSRNNLKLKVDVERAKAAVSESEVLPFSLNDIELLDALSCEVTEKFEVPDEVVTLGSGPFPEDQFDDYLLRLGIEADSSGYPWIIVGREGWIEEKLDNLLEDVDLNEIRIFSQELFLIGYLTTHDPFSLPDEILLKFAEGHPALEYLINSGFEWPVIVVEEDYGEPVYVRGGMVRVDESPLARMGYHVGVNKGLPRSKRKKLLTEAYRGEIPEVEDDDYMEEWGRPSNSRRLWRIAHHLAWLIRSRHGNPSMIYAVDDWRQDLDWLKEEFYTNRMRFSWPNG